MGSTHTLSSHIHAWSVKSLVFPLSSLGSIVALPVSLLLCFIADERPKQSLAQYILSDLPYSLCESMTRDLGRQSRTTDDPREHRNKWQDKAERPLTLTPHTSASMIGVIDLITAFLIFCIASSFSLLIHVPLLGALVRFRANYTPKGLQIGEEGGMTPHVGPVVPNYFAMLLRIKRIEVRVVSPIGSVRSGWSTQG